jgi:hypothetical protein
VLKKENEKTKTNRGPDARVTRAFCTNRESEESRDSDCKTPDSSPQRASRARGSSDAALRSAPRLVPPALRLRSALPSPVRSRASGWFILHSWVSGSVTVSGSRLTSHGSRAHASRERSRDALKSHGCSAHSRESIEFPIRRGATCHVTSRQSGVCCPSRTGLRLVRPMSEKREPRCLRSVAYVHDSLSRDTAVSRRDSRESRTFTCFMFIYTPQKPRPLTSPAQSPHSCACSRHLEALGSL